MNKKILIADDHEVVLTGTMLALESRMDGLTIHLAEDYPEVTNKISKEKYDLIILDINMPGSKNKKMITEIKEKNPEVKILVFSAYEESIAIQYLREGADGYLNKLGKIDEICKAVESIFTDGYYFPTGIVKKLLQVSMQGNVINPVEILSERELEIFTLMVKGHGNKEISNLMSIRMPTISTYKRRIYTKLQTTNIADLIRIHHIYMS